MNIENLNLKFSQALTPIKNKITKIVCHHPAHSTWTIQDIHNYHRNTNKWSGIGYNYFITFDGRIQQGRGRNVGAHVTGHNGNTLGICFQGNFETQQMTDAQVKAGAKLIAYLLKNEGLQVNDVIGHKDLAATSCPGRNFRMNDLKQAILAELKGEIKVSNNQSPGPFKDVPVNHHAVDALKYVKDKGLMRGYPDGSFKPNEPITRAQMAQILFNMSK